MVQPPLTARRGTSLRWVSRRDTLSAMGERIGAARPAADIIPQVIV